VDETRNDSRLSDGRTRHAKNEFQDTYSRVSSELDIGSSEGRSGQGEGSDSDTGGLGHLLHVEGHGRDASGAGRLGRGGLGEGGLDGAGLHID
jgi:hypothetical protein